MSTPKFSFSTLLLQAFEGQLEHIEKKAVRHSEQLGSFAQAPFRMGSALKSYHRFAGRSDDYTHGLRS